MIKKLICLRSCFIHTRQDLFFIKGENMFNKAIVIGGSMAGKFAAKALSTSFKEIIIIEAGERWDGKSSRKRVPQ